MAKKGMPLYSIGPWPNGQNTVQRSDSDIFQLQDPDSMFKKGNLGSLIKAVNVDIDNDGWPSRRTGTSRVLVGVNGLSGYTNKNIYLYQEGTSLYSVNTSTWTKTELFSGENSSR